MTYLNHLIHLIHLNSKRLIYFLGSAIISASILLPRPSSSITIQTIDASACHELSASSSTINYGCFMVGGSGIQTGVRGAYFDYFTGVAHNVTLQLHRVSYTGSISTDSSTLNNSSGQVDAWVPAVNTVQNPSVWDYWWGEADGIDFWNGSMTGVALVVN